jgi:ornithine decarboxylase
MAKNIFNGVFIDTTLKNLRQLISRFPAKARSVSVVSPFRIEAQWSAWKDALPDILPYYAVKCNPEPILLRKLIQLGVNFDCASLREVYDVKKSVSEQNMIPPHIIYAHPLKSTNDIETIGSMGIDITVVDSLEECDKLLDSKWKGKAFIRVVVNDGDSKMPFSSKFGADYSELMKIVTYSKIPIYGVSFHVGSGCMNPLLYKDAIAFASNTIFDILKRHNHNPRIIDIGGGFSSDPNEFSKCANVIQGAIGKNDKNKIFIAEPGRFFGQPSQDLFVKVIAKKPGLGGRGWRYVIDESVYGHFSCIPFDHQTPAWFRIPTNNLESGRGMEEGILFGRTCDSLDVIAKGRMEELKVGDWLYFPLMGAYTSATASEFNGFPKPEILEDTTNLLPNIQYAWDMKREFHRRHVELRYSNTLELMK